MPIHLTPVEISAALPRLKRGVQQYVWLQAHRDRDLSSDREFRRRFNAFYRVRRGPAWQDAFFRLLERSKQTSPTFRGVLEHLHASTGRYEASFASKLLATVAPEYPVIDAEVLRNVGLRLPPYGTADRFDRICEVHHRLAEEFEEYLLTASGTELVAAFRSAFPHAAITEVKMVDLVLWQTR